MIWYIYIRNYFNIYLILCVSFHIMTFHNAAWSSPGLFTAGHRRSQSRSSISDNLRVSRNAKGPTWKVHPKMGLWGLLIPINGFCKVLCCCSGWICAVQVWSAILVCHGLSVAATKTPKSYPFHLCSHPSCNDHSGPSDLAEKTDPGQIQRPWPSIIFNARYAKVIKAMTRINN